MFTTDYKLSGWVYRMIGFLVLAIGCLAVSPQPAEAFIFRAIGRGILGAGRLVGRGVLGVGRVAGAAVRGVGRVGLGVARGVGRIGVGVARGAGRLVLGTGRFLAGGPFFARRGAF